MMTCLLECCTVSGNTQILTKLLLMPINQSINPESVVAFRDYAAKLANKPKKSKKEAKLIEQIGYLIRSIVDSSKTIAKLEGRAE
jgi:hypothetical protein